MQDLKYAIRMLLGHRVFSAVVIVTLALGLGATGAIYTVVESVLIDPLPFEQPEELTLLWTRNVAENQDKYFVSPMDFDDWRTMNATFESMAAYWPTTGTITETEGDPLRVAVVYTTEDFFDVMGARAIVGRTFTAEDGPGSTQVAILSYGLWQTRFGGDPSVLGTGIILDGQPLEVIGVVRRDHTFPTDADLWTNMTWTMQIQSRVARWMSAVGRLKQGVDVETAGPDMVAVAARIAEQNPGTNRGWTVTMNGLGDEMVGDARSALLILLTSTGLILLIAIANVANLLLSRAEVRSREIAVRVAFGAGRWRLVRQLLTESVILGGVGALAGLALAYAGVPILLGLAPVALPRADAIALDGSSIAAVLILGVLAGALFGLAPILRLAGSDVHSTIRDGTRSTAGARGRRLQNAFVVAQLALALILVAGAGLLVRSFANLRSIDTGFVASGVLTAELDVPTSVAEDDQDVIDFYEQFRNRVAMLPGVEVVGDAATLPLGELLDYNQVFSFANRVVPAEIEARAFLRPVSPGFFQAMRTPILAGRDFETTDRVGMPGAVIVNESFVRRFLGDDEPIGERFVDFGYRFGPLGALNVDEVEVVGVVKDLKYEGLRSEPVAAIYFSGLQSSLRRRTLTIRTSGRPGDLIPALRTELAALNSSVALTDVQTMEEVVGAARAGDRFSATLLSLFGIIALLLASIGVYGVLAYAVEQRTSEVGIRMALGASRDNVRNLVIKDGARVVVLGLAVGLVGAVVLSRVLSSQLFGVSPRDPAVLMLGTGVLFFSGLLASFVPAWRAARVDPIVAMRAD